jgi:hypothetical protein
MYISSTPYFCTSCIDFTLPIRYKSSNVQEKSMTGLRNLIARIKQMLAKRQQRIQSYD